MKLSVKLIRARKIVSLALLMSLALAITHTARATQGQIEPRREQLLNGLRILHWQRPGDGRVTLKLRIHSGAAFDLAGKAGMMALLGDALFPDPTTREFFTEELGGRIEVTTDYDAINVTMTGNASGFERMVELLRNALVSTQLSTESVAHLREARLKVVRESGIAPAMLADRAISTRLFGDYPYGRPFMGATETLARIDRADLMLARDRFLNPNNSTLVIIGGVDERRTMRALRQLLGGWRKSDSVIPATFRQPDAPDTRTLIIDLPGAETAEVRLAARALTRSDRDYPAAMLLALLARDRWQASLPELNKSAFFVRHEGHILPGSFVMGSSVRGALAANALAAARKVVNELATAQVSAQELERVRSEALAILNRQTEQPDTLAELWLDIETFKLAPVTDQTRALSTVTPADVQRVAARLFRDAPIATVAIGSAADLRADLERTGKVEILSETTTPKPNATPATMPTTPAPAKRP